MLYSFNTNGAGAHFCTKVNNENTHNEMSEC